MQNTLLKPLALTVGLFASLLPHTSFGTPNQPQKAGLVPLTSHCLQQSALRHGVLALELLMILYSEQGTTGENTGNTNDTYDIGLFQINSIHLGEIARTFGFSEARLRNDGCANAEVAAWHLNRVAPAGKLAQVQSEDEYFSILANYHSFTPRHNARYAGMLKNAFYKLQGSR